MRDRSGEAMPKGGVLIGHLGMVLSLGCLGWALTAGPRLPAHSLSDLPMTLPIPFLLILPGSYLLCLGVGLGGDSAGSDVFGALGRTAFSGAPATFLAGRVAARRGRKRLSAAQVDFFFAAGA